MLYGSQARGDATEGSDIDVMVVLRDEPTKAEDEMKLNLACELSFKYDTLVSLLLVSQERFRLGGSPLLINVRREGVSV